MLRSNRCALWTILLLFTGSTLSSALEGTLEWIEISSPALEENLIDDTATKTLGIYLPPSYQTSNKSYPVVYFLPGFFTPLWYPYFQGEMKKQIIFLEEMILDNEIEETIYVMVDGFNKFYGSHYISSPTIGDWEMYLTQDVVGFIDANYRTITSRDSRGIEGYSTGGTGAQRMAFKYPDVFSVVVSHAGDHDFDTEAWRAYGRATAFVDPQNWSDYENLGPVDGMYLHEMFALAAGCASNPNNPPFFLDKPAQLVDGKAQLIPEVWEKIISQDNISNLERYLDQPVRLNGIKVIHGAADDVVPVEQGRAFHDALTSLGVVHVYLEHAGGHDWLLQESMPFISDQLGQARNGIQIVSVPTKVGVGISDRSIPAEATVRLAGPAEGTGEYPPMMLDFSSLGLNETIPLISDGAGGYVVHTQITAPAQHGFYLLPIRVQQADGTWVMVQRTTLEVYPDEERILWADDLTPEWTEPSSFIATLDPQAKTQVFEGQTSLSLQSNRTNTSTYLTWTPTEPVEGFGYRLHFAFHPGVLEGVGDPPAFNMRLKKDNDLVIMNLVGDAGTPSSIDLQQATWQVVTLPVGMGLIQSITFTGNLQGTFYLDDIRLVPEEPPPPNTAVLEERTDAVPQTFALDQNYPNPFNSSTVIRFALPQSQDIELAIFNLAGQKVATLVTGERPAGTYTVRWNGTDDAGQALASGVYLYRLQAGNGKRVEARKLLLLR